MMNGQTSDTSMTDDVSNSAADEAQSHSIEERNDSKFSFFSRVSVDAHYVITNWQTHFAGTNL